MKIRDIMSRDVQVARPEDTVQSIAQRMATGDFGFMPVAEGETLVGTITDRDLAVRALANAAQPDTQISEYLSRNPLSVRDDDDLKMALDMMSRARIRRLPVTDKNNRLVGVVSLGDLSVRVKERYAGEALESISTK